jgi:hypothetical protein
LGLNKSALAADTQGMKRRCVPCSGSLFLQLVAAFGGGLLWAQEPVVTATKEVRVGRNQRETLRKINGRWWTRDNRLVNPPKSQGGFGIWVVDSKPGVCPFEHHVPFDTRRGEQLQLWLTRDSIAAAFGRPTRRCLDEEGGSGFWYYHDSDGTILQLRFFSPGELAEANYLLPTGQRIPVAALEQQRGGESIYRLSAQRAGERRRAGQPASRSASRSRSGGGGGTPPPIPQAREPERPARRTVITAEALAAVAAGASKEQVIQQLGEPSSQSSLTGDEGVRETLSYHLADGQAVAIRFLNGLLTAKPGAAR